jgi:hypothetical protein
MVPSFFIYVKQCPEDALAHILLDVHHINRMVEVLSLSNTVAPKKLTASSICHLLQYSCQPLFAYRVQYGHP